MFYLNTRSLISLDKINFIVFKGLMINRLLNFNYNDRLYNVFFSVGDIISLEVLRTESKFKNLLKHVTIHRYIGRVIARNNKGINTSFILRNVYHGVPIEFNFPLFSPLIVSIQILQNSRRFFFHSKLYVFRELSNRRSSIKFVFSTVITKYIYFCSGRFLNMSCVFDNRFLFETFFLKFNI